MSFQWAASANVGTATSATLSKGANTITTGDLLFALVNVGANTSVTAPDGTWTLVTNTNVYDNQQTAACFWKVAGSSESGSYIFSFGSSPSSWALLDYGAQTFDNSSATQVGVGLSHTLPSVTPGAGNTTDIWIGMGVMVGGAASYNMTAGPTNSRANHTSGASTEPGFVIFDIQLASSSATGTGTYTQSDSSNPATGISIVIAPPASPSSGPTTFGFATSEW